MQIICQLPDTLLPIGTKVFIPRTAIGGVEEDEIVGYNTILERSSTGTLHLTPTDYRLNTGNAERSEGEGDIDVGWKSDEFFLSYEEAKANAYEIQVDVSNDDWFNAIGVTETGGTPAFEACELGECCALTEHIRGILAKVAWSGKITGTHRSILAKLLAAHEPPDNFPELTKILALMALTWSKNKNETNSNHNNAHGQHNEATAGQNDPIPG